MNRNNNIGKRFPNYYNHFKLDEKRKEANLSFRKLAAVLNMDRQAVTRACRGLASQKLVWPIAQYLKADWRDLHDFSSFQRVSSCGIRPEGRAVIKGSARGSVDPVRKARGTYTAERR